jgi:hypothetical protein
LNNIKNNQKLGQKTEITDFHKVKDAKNYPENYYTISTLSNKAYKFNRIGNQLTTTTIKLSATKQNQSN